MSMYEIDPTTKKDLDAQSEEQTGLAIDERVLDYMESRAGATIGVQTIYNGVFGEQPNPDNATDQAKLAHITDLFDEETEQGQLFIDFANSEGLVFQRGTMVIGLDDTEQTRKPVYRLFNYTDYIPALHTATYFNKTSNVEWQPAQIKTELLPEIPTNEPEMPTIKKASGPKPQRTQKKKKVSEPSDKSVHDKRLEEWDKAVDEAIGRLASKGLITQDEIKPGSAQRKSGSKIIGTETNRERLFKAGLLPREAMSVDHPVTSKDLVIMAIFNRHPQLMGQKSPQQRLAVQIVEEKLDDHFSDQEQE